MTNISDYPLSSWLILLFIPVVFVIMVGCSVSSDEDERITPIERLSNDLKVLADTDYYEYSVVGTITETTLIPDATNPNLIGTGTCTPEVETHEAVNVTGTLRIDWSIDSIPQPLMATPNITVYRQEAVWTLTSSDSPAVDLSIYVDLTNADVDYLSNTLTIRHTSYFSQDSDGSLRYRAVPDNPTLNEYFWLSTASTQEDWYTEDGDPVLDKNDDIQQTRVAVLDSIISPLLYRSPVPTTISTDNFTIHFNEGCDGATQCNEASRYMTGSNNYLGEESEGLETAYGFFDPLNINYNFNVIDRDILREVVLMPDFRAFCKTQDNDFSFGFRGNIWLLPEFGVLKFTTICTQTLTDDIDMNAVTDPDRTCTIPTDAALQTVTVDLPVQWSFTMELTDSNVELPQ